MGRRKGFLKGPASVYPGRFLVEANEPLDPSWKHDADTTRAVYLMHLPDMPVLVVAIVLDDAESVEP